MTNVIALNPAPHVEAETTDRVIYNSLHSFLDDLQQLASDYDAGPELTRCIDEMFHAVDGLRYDNGQIAYDCLIGMFAEWARVGTALTASVRAGDLDAIPDDAAMLLNWKIKSHTGRV